MYYNPQLNKTVLTLSDVRHEFTHITLPENITEDVLNSVGFYSVVPTSPVYDSITQTVEESLPQLVNNVYEQSWKVIDLDAATIQENKQKAQLAIFNEQKLQRKALVDNIIVTTKEGNQFNGDEVSQGRMARAIMALNAAGVTTTDWILADNVKLTINVTELAEALILSGIEQTKIWMAPYDS